MKEPVFAAPTLLKSGILLEWSQIQHIISVIG